MNPTFSLKILQIGADGVLILFSFVLAYFFRIGSLSSTDFPFLPYISVGMAVTVIWLLFLVFARAYTFDQQPATFRHFQRLAFGSIVGIAAFALAFFFAQKLFFSRLLLVYLGTISTVLVFLNHLVFQQIEKMLHRRGIGVVRTLVIGTNRKAVELITTLKKKNSRHLPVAILDGYGSKLKEIAGVPVLGKLDKLESTVEKERIEQMIQTDNIEHTLNLIQFSKQKGLLYAMLPSLLGVFEGEERIAGIEGIPVERIEFHRTFWQRLWEL